MAQFNHRSSFPQHPPDHPLWRDVNFTPREVYLELIVPLQGKAPETKSKKKASKQKLSESQYEADPADSGPKPGPWNQQEDVMLIFMQSSAGKNFGIDYETMGRFLNKSSNAVKCRWHAHVKGFVENMPSNDYDRAVQFGEEVWRSKVKPA
jgi:hypothetical protein